MNEDLHQLLNPVWRLPRRMLLDQITTLFDSRCIFFGDVVVDPSEVSVGSAGWRRLLKLFQSSCNHAIAEQTRQQADLQRQPVLRLSNVEHVA